MQTTFPKNVSGTVYVVISTSKDALTDSNTVAGPYAPSHPLVRDSRLIILLLFYRAIVELSDPDVGSWGSKKGGKHH